MPVVVEPVLNLEKVMSLLAEGHEQSALDYKKELSTASAKEIAEFAKDICAFQSEASGGYILVGVDNAGNPVSNVTDKMAKELDEANLRAKLGKFFKEPPEIRVAAHVLTGSSTTVCLIYIAPSRFGFSVMAVDGQYSVGEGAARKSQYVFRSGDVFVRHGTASERWNDADRERIVANVVDQRKQEWREELRNDLMPNAVVPGQPPQSLRSAPASSMTWNIDEAGFEDLVTELLRDDDDIPLRRLLLRAPAQASSLYEENSEDLLILVDRLLSMAALGLHYDRSAWCGRTISTLSRIYEIAQLPAGHDFPTKKAGLFWINLIARVYCLGALATRLNKWREVETIATMRPNFEGLTRYYGSWLRHSLTMAARANELNTPDSGTIARARVASNGILATRADLPGDNEELTTSLCAFDVLGNLAVLSKHWGEGLSTFYPSFARYYSNRSQQAFLQVIENEETRAAIFPLPDADLADAIAALQARASQENIMGFSEYGGFAGSRVEKFVEEHKTDRNPLSVH